MTDFSQFRDDVSLKELWQEMLGNSNIDAGNRLEALLKRDGQENPRIAKGV